MHCIICDSTYKVNKKSGLCAYCRTSIRRSTMSSEVETPNSLKIDTTEADRYNKEVTNESYNRD